MLPIRNSSLLIMLVVVLIGAFGCKSKKKAMEAAAAEKARVERESAEQKRQAEALAKREAEDKARWEEAQRAKENENKISTPKARLGQYFDAVTGSGNVASANSSINEALSMFASPNTPVLIVISEEGGMKDYDKPTTIKDYLNYLKDQKKNMNSISNIVSDSNGKITELELRKN